MPVRIDRVTIEPAPSEPEEREAIVVAFAADRGDSLSAWESAALAEGVESEGVEEELDP